MVRLWRSNARSISDADVVVLGVPDESGSHAERKGTRRAPDTLRRAWNEFEFFKRNGNHIPISPMDGSFEGKAIFDMGNVQKKNLRKTIASISSQHAVPISIGGDHSITTEAVKGVSQAHRTRLAIFYFDAHPDFVSSTLNYYGSVLADCSHELNLSRSALVGIRAAEPEELVNAKRNNLMILSPLDVSKNSLRVIAQKLVARAGQAKKYISIDLDCLDPSHAPGVSLPSPCGLSSTQLVYLLKELIRAGGVEGLDIVELSPDYDSHNITAGLAAKILSECIASFEPRASRVRNRTRKVRT